MFSVLSGVKNALTVSFGKNKYEGSTQWTEEQGLFWSLAATDIDGHEFPFEQLKGNVCLVINVACKCGFTQASYTKLEQLSQKYSDKGLRILCFPSNQFLSQEPWTEAEIKEWVMGKWPNLKVNMFSKIDVNGESTHPVYVWLKKALPGDIIWNFSSKFLIGANGTPIARFEKNQPWSEIEVRIKEALEEANGLGTCSKDEKKEEHVDENPGSEKMQSSATDSTTEATKTEETTDATTTDTTAIDATATDATTTDATDETTTEATTTEATTETTTETTTEAATEGVETEEKSNEVA